jgi:hypothetical protein
VEPEVTPPRSRGVCTFFAAAVGITYFGMLVLSVRYGQQDQRAADYMKLGQFLNGELNWYQDARVYGAVALLFALVSLLFGLSPLARITIPVAGACYVLLVFSGDWIAGLIESWARQGG